MQESDPSASLDWERVRPVLDDALAELDERDREAILLRYLEGHDFASVGAKLALTDNAARMRVDRAVDKLRSLLARRGVTSSAAALALVLANQAVVAAPAGLAATVTGTALAVGTGTAATLTFMSLTKLQLSLASAVVVTGAGIYTVQEQTNTALRAELANGAPAIEETTRLRQENEQLRHTTRQVANLQVSDAELVELHDEAAALQRQLQATAQPVPQTRPLPPMGQAFSIKELDRKPTATFRKAPHYPAELRAAGINGSVVVTMVVDATGKVIQTQVEKSTHRGFEFAALQAVQEWQFEPGRKGGRAVNTRVSQVLEFRAGNGPQTAGAWF